MTMPAQGASPGITCLQMTTEATRHLIIGTNHDLGKANNLSSDLISIKIDITKKKRRKKLTEYKAALLITESVNPFKKKNTKIKRCGFFLVFNKIKKKLIGQNVIK
jgi:hypothetical protein